MINGAPNTVELTQHSKGKNNKIYGFEWVNNKEIVFITEQSIEIYDIDVNSMYVKLIKSLSINSHWFVYDYKTKLLLLSTGWSKIQSPLFFFFLAFSFCVSYLNLHNYLTQFSINQQLFNL